MKKWQLRIHILQIVVVLFVPWLTSHRASERGRDVGWLRRRRIVPSTKSRTSRAITKILIGLEVLQQGEKAMVKRSYAGRNQLSSGAWVTIFLRPDGRDFGGSHFTAAEIIKAKKLSTYYDRCGDWHVFVEEKGGA